MGSKKSGGSRKIGRNLAKCQRYRLQGRREKNKVRRVLKSNGLAEAERYAAEHGVTRYLRALLEKRRQQARN